jgi:hypothetical protein
MAFKVMTWNVENLFRPGAPSGPKTQAVYDENLDGLAAVINAEAPYALGSRRSATRTSWMIWNRACTAPGIGGYPSTRTAETSESRG